MWSPLFDMHTAEQARSLLQVSPHLASQENVLGELALHTLVRRPGGAGIVREVLKIYPEGARKWTGAWSSLPHHVVPYDGDVETLDVLLEAYPEGARLPDHEDQLPILHAAKNGQLEMVKTLMRAYPDGVRYCGRFGTPLMEAATRGHVAVVKVLLDAFPEDIHQRDILYDGQTILHRVVSPGHANGRLEMVKFLLDTSPALAWLESADGKLPIHVACDQEVVELLLRAYPQGARHQDHRGALPLHTATNIGITHVLFRAYPEGIRHRDSEGMFPLHSYYAQGRHAQAHWIMGYWPGAAACRDHRGDLPFDIGLRQYLNPIPHVIKPSKAVLMCLLAEHPQAIVPHLQREKQPPDFMAMLPVPYPGIEAALPAVLARSRDEAKDLMRFLTPKARDRARDCLLTTMLCIKRRLPILNAFTPEHHLHDIYAAAAACHCKPPPTQRMCSVM